MYYKLKDTDELEKLFGEELVDRLVNMNLPVTKAEQAGGLFFCQAYYKRKDGTHSKWITDTRCFIEKPPKYRYEWSFYPLGIGRREDSFDSADPKNQLYLFDAECCVGDGIRPGLLYQDKMVATSDGTVLIWGDKNLKEKTLDRLPKFPKSMLAKINRCLMNNFLPDLWMGGGYAKWHRTDEEIYRYMLTYGYKKEPYIEPLLSLLRSNYGSAAAILLAFSCFSVAKPFFPQYTSLDKASSYRQAKKYIPRQISINIRSDSPDIAIQLANLCCGCFSPNELPAASSGHRRGKEPVIDGIVVQSPQSTYLGVDSFEAAVLQPAYVLWVNRRPAQELVRSGKIIDVALPSDIEEIGCKPFARDLIAAWTEEISKMTIAAHQKMVEDDWAESACEVGKMLGEIEKIFQEELLHSISADLRKVRSMLQGPCAFDIVSKFRVVERYIKNEVMSIIEAEKMDENDPFLPTKEKIWKILAQCRRTIKKNHNRNMKENFQFGDHYEEVADRMKIDPRYSEIDPGVIEKITYLHTSFEFFVSVCIPKENQKEVFGIFRKALDELFVKDKRSPQEILEKYIKGLLTQKHFARVRGKGSDRPDVRVWYDARHDLFLLPKDTYFSDLRKLLPKGLAITQTEWEKQLVKEGLVLYADRAKQKRYGYEIKLRQGSDQKQAVLKIPCGNLSKEFFEDAAVKAAIEQMEADPTKLRS